MNKVASLFILLSYVFACITFVFAGDKPVALFIVNDAGAANEADVLVDEELQAIGFDVLMLSAVEVVPGGADGAALVIISSTTLSSQLGVKFTAAEAGVLSWEGGMYDDLLMCSGPAWGNSTMSTNMLTIVDPGHPLAAGLSGDVAVVTEIPQEYTIIKKDSLIDSGIQIATMIDDIGEEQTVIVGFEKGAILYDGSTAAGRRCGLFMRDNTATALTDEGWQLLKSSVMWTAGMEETGVETLVNNIPQSSRLLANYPNPFNPSTTIPYILNEAGKVRIDVYDALGHHIKTLLEGEISAGQHQVQWNGANDLGQAASSGIYFVQMNLKETHSFQKVLLTK